MDLVGAGVRWSGEKGWQWCVTHSNSIQKSKQTLAQPLTQCSVPPVVRSIFLMPRPWKGSKPIRNVGSQCQGRLPRDGRNKCTSYLHQRKALILPEEVIQGHQQQDFFDGDMLVGGRRGVDRKSGCGHLCLCIVRGLHSKSLRRHSNTNSKLTHMERIRLVFSRVSAKSFIKKRTKCFIEMKRRNVSERYGNRKSEIEMLAS